jgi:hypothetical protein
LQASQAKAQQAQRLNDLDYKLKASEYTAQLASAAKNQQDWDMVKAHMVEVLGPEAESRFPAQFSPEAQAQVVNGAMSFRDKIAQQRLDQDAEKTQQGWERIEQGDRRIDAMLAKQNDGGGDKKQGLVWDAARGVFVDPNTRTFITPTGQGGEALPQKPVSTRQGGLSATAQKELFEADDMVMAGENVQSAIDAALELNNKAYSGIGATERAVIRSNLPGQSEAADATVQMNNIILGQALESLKSTFGAAPTEGERRILVDLQASVDKTPQQREAILTRAKEMAAKRVMFNRKKADALRSGEYFASDQEASEQPAERPPLGAIFGGQ